MPHLTSSLYHCMYEVKVSTCMVCVCFLLMRTKVEAGSAGDAGTPKHAVSVDEITVRVSTFVFWLLSQSIVGCYHDNCNGCGCCSAI